MGVPALSSNLAILLTTMLASGAHADLDGENHERHRFLYKDEGTVYIGGWSPDGKYVSATSNRVSGPVALKISVKSGKARQIEIPVAGAWFGGWSPDGKQTLLESNVDGNPEVYVYSLESGAAERLTFSDANEWHPAWSNSGQKLVLDSSRMGQLDLFVLDIDTGEIQRLTQDDRPEQYGRWGPDDSDIVFYRYVGPEELDYDLFKINLESRIETRLTDVPGDDSSPDWSQDGKHIAFHSNRNGLYKIFVMCADGSEVTQVTFGQSQDRYPYWSPSGDEILFQSEAGSDTSLVLVSSLASPECPEYRSHK